MKVASVSILCQDERVFKAMEMAGTPCPYQGKIGAEATMAWAENKSKRPDVKEQEKFFIYKKKCTHDRNPKQRKKINKEMLLAQLKLFIQEKLKPTNNAKKSSMLRSS